MRQAAHVGITYARGDGSRHGVDHAVRSVGKEHAECWHACKHRVLEVTCSHLYRTLHSLAHAPVPHARCPKSQPSQFVEAMVLWQCEALSEWLSHQCDMTAYELHGRHASVRTPWTPWHACAGLRAGFSHSPVVGGRERYVFVSMTHIGIDSHGRIGSIHRPGRSAGPSTACGALAAILSQFKADPRAVPRFAAQPRTAHDATDAELSILRNRLARYIHASGANAAQMYLPDFTSLAERVITADLEALIRETVDVSAADYAVVTGVQVHSWPEADSREPLLEFAAPRVAYAVCGGVRTELQLQVRSPPPLRPRAYIED